MPDQEEDGGEEVTDDKTHYEKTTTEMLRAQKFVAQHGDDLSAAMSAMAQAGRPYGLLDVMREYLAPIADLDFQSFFEHPRCQTAQEFLIQLGVDAGAGMTGVLGEVRTQLNICWHQLQFRGHGHRTYVVAPGLAQRLLLTELRGVRGTDLALPYPSIYVAVPPELGLVINNAHTGDHAVFGVYISARVSRWLLLMCTLPNEKSIGPFDDALSHFVVELSDKPVEDALQAFKARVQATAESWSREMNMIGVEVDKWLRVFRWVMNLAFYVTRPGFDDLEHVELNKEAASLWRRAQKMNKGPKRQKVMERWRAEPKRSRIVVGQKVVFNPNLPRTVGEVTRPLSVRSLVAGHWQRYAVGRGRTERVWKYREPFWRGPDDAPEGSNVHEVK